jgi:multiple sugar transport system substrate-binding protein
VKKRFMPLMLALCLLVTLALGSCAGSPAASSTPPVSAAPEESKAEESAPEPVVPVDREDGLPAYTGEPVELRFTWWGNDERAEITNKVIDKFHAAYPEITIVGEPKPSDSYWDSLNAQLEGGNAPDLIQFGGNYPDFVSYLLPLQDYNGSLLQINTPETFDQAVLTTGTTDGNLYGICLGTNCLVLAYNKTVLEAAGAPLPADNMTWDEMIAYGDQIAPLLPDGVWPFVDNSVNQANYISYFFQQRDEPIWTYEGETFATEEGALAWINMWEDMREKGLIPDIETTSGYGETGTDNSALVAGKAVFGLIWSNQFASYQGAMTDTLALCQLPTGENNALVIQVSQYLAINNTCSNPEAAALFVNYFVTTEAAGEELATNRGIPSSPLVRDAIAGKATDIDRQLYEYLSVAADRTVPQGPNLPNDQEFIDTLKQIGQSVSFGELTREQGAKDVFDLIQRLMVK